VRPTSWLLLGGPAHGVVHEVFFSTKILWDHEGRNYLYTPQVHNDESTGKSYMLGLWQPREDELDFLIKSRKVPPIVWDNSVPAEEPKQIE
jgi:hypothetical protein